MLLHALYVIFEAFNKKLKNWIFHQSFQNFIYLCGQITVAVHSVAECKLHHLKKLLSTLNTFNEPASEGDGGTGPDYKFSILKHIFSEQ